MKNKIIDEAQGETVFEKSEEEKAYVKKLNWTFLPLVGAIVFIQFCDKASLSIAAVMGIMEDASLTGEEFSWLGSIFYLGYLLFQLPNNVLLQRVSHGPYLGVLLVLWGTVMIITAICHNFVQLAVARFFLGLFEAGTNPCLYIILSRLYRRSEQSACFGFTTICTGLGIVIGTVASFGISYMDKVGGWRAWRWGYIIFGVATIILGAIVFFFLVDDPNSPLLRLTEKQKLIVEERTRDNAVVKSSEFKYYQVWEAVKEPRLWLLSIATLCSSLQNGGLITFSTQFVKGLGFSSTQSILLQIPGGLAAALGALVGVWISRRTNQMIYTSILMSSISMVGCVLLATIPQGAIKLLGYYISWAVAGATTLALTIISNDVSGYTKKICYNGMNMVFFTVGNFIGPLMMVERQSPRYVGGMVGFAAANIVTILCMLLVRILMSRENKKRLANGPYETTDVYLDKTDAEDKNFIYRL
ncbi:major facilitator superfamily domain-containing protein [Phycomyces nitens]|nr:major facilitator superfamily domain-containing protein [Phycomyces nitens]